MILAGALFYATVTFSFFSVQQYCTLSNIIIYHTDEVHTSAKKRGIFSPKHEARA